MDVEVLYGNRFSAKDRAWKQVVWQVLSEKIFAVWVPREGTLLDLGAGYCEFVNAAKAGRRIAVDLNPETRTCAAPGVEVHTVGAEKLDFLNDGEVDVVFSSNFFEHLPDKATLSTVLAEAYRVLKGGGRLVLVGPNVRFLPGEYWDYFDHHIPLSEKSIGEAVCTAGFRLEYVVARFLPYTVKSCLPRSRWLLQAYLALRPFSSWLMGKQFLVVARKPSIPVASAANVKAGSVAIIGGCGHVGLPLGLSFARRGLDVRLFDVNSAVVRRVREGHIPFTEEGAAPILQETLGKNLVVSDQPQVLADAENVVCVVGTPIDEHLNPRIGSLFDAIELLLPQLNAAQLFVLRSTVYPGATEKVNAWLQRKLPGIDVAFCPERVVQGFAVKEIATMPQIVAGTTPKAHARAKKLFDSICSETVDLAPIEAEIGKLFCNSWRYITFAVANQFYSVCAENGLDYYRIWEGITRDYPRLQSLPKAGFAAGPCLFKDTMQLSAFFANDFSLGHAAMLVNEGLPRTVVRMLKERFELDPLTVGILGMAFKGDSDDTRDALSFKLRKLLKLECREVLCTDSHVAAADFPDFVSLDTVLAKADVLVIGAPHSQYRDLKPRQPVLDPWNIMKRGGLLA